MLFLLITVLVSCFAVFVILWSWGPGKPKPFLDENGFQIAGSISEKIRVNINGIEQGIFIKGKDKMKPVLLYLHGGMPDYFLTQEFPTPLEDDFVVAWWEQRGAGISFDPKASGEVTLAQLESDVIAVTDYLRNRFRKDKIYLMGHSGGTFIGIKAASQVPEKYHAYIGVAQMSYQLRSEELAHEYMLKQFRESGNEKMVRKLEAAPVSTANGASKAYLALRDKAMHQLGVGTMHEMKSVITGIFLPSWRFREYSLKEKINLWLAKASAGVSIVWNNMMSTDLIKEVPEIDIPAYFFHGIYDYTCSYPLAKTYFQQLKAPVKGFYSFQQSAHSPIFEEPEKMQHILRTDVLKGHSSLADGE